MTSSLIVLMKNDSILIWFNFLLRLRLFFLYLKFFVLRYILFLFFSWNFLFLFLFWYFVDVVCIFKILLCIFRNVFILFMIDWVVLTLIDRLNKFDSLSKFAKNDVVFVVFYCFEFNVNCVIDSSEIQLFWVWFT